MPLVDKPLNELKQYMGRTPRPTDFDAYWDRALAEMRAVDPDIELKAFDFPAENVECNDLFFTGVRNARIHAKLLRPKRRPEKLPAVVFFHGYSGHSGQWSDYLGYASNGFVVAAMDCRGQGGCSEDTGGVKGTTFRGHIIRGLDDHPDNLLMRHIFLDTAQLAGIVMNLPEVDPARVGAAGGSQGGGLTLACAALETNIARAMPVYPFLCDYRHVWEMDLAKGAYEEIRTYFRQFDPRHEREDEIFTKLGYIDNSHLAARIKARVLMVVGLMDTTCPPSTQFAAYNKITSPKELVIYPDYGHEGLPDVNDIRFRFLSDL